MKIIINGKQEKAKEGITIKEFFGNLGLDSTRVAVELNKEIVRKSEYSETILKDGDTLEIVSFVGGG
ncbi:MAG: thiamine biosynthesis protein ThiS [Candidatus Schekmanbacteria bacterium RIFCSPHIGHO2_02_FULL_38_11]|uniref:Thiamine biosynthesis protein ThiS n=1 Tax=Candidatus Schekmanbacteria bacterium RIFCSPLOWO2_12_FULL_38_15 TaxID=1817883 RepID=A0A1F7SQC7_9BACT|nr:MAG: thiamine biosynthesis protein ThiS [Candidatus Schekmanbacteria bacterium GWA2_38_9]OGL49826.1 MAG: thiamine biosynthesis protein ThiS [Candidatus Schekmanbacteria bacterium RIFCSPHIGHO2_02_FULL_38_11]OGL50285.1 MAG: thiamine biosynthesis protein ThiS [Candidatus Schekmanbacteria bacterium RIFCSPLOWO2_02_FULL_38_14]OGL55404.1 MAG: thiamine biosynthesis protein ThiS [Candidatus Schekmanbacteria bacterium RIFCSPLOWO2_12_FULL_38_15]